MQATMKNSGVILLLLVAMSASVSFADEATTASPSMDSAQARAQAFQNLTPEQQQAAIGAAKQQGQATAQQKQQNWNSMTPEQQQAQKQTTQSNMQTKMQGMNGQAGNGQMGGNMNGEMKMHMQEKMQGMRSRMNR